MPRRAVTIAALGLALAAPVARANGRFPSAQHVEVGPAAASTAVVVRTTFGFFVSRDGGNSFSWICEEGVGYGGGWDPPFALTSGGALLLGLQDGLARGEDDCAFGRVPTVPDGVDDLAVSPDGRRVVAATWGVSGPRVFTSDDGGATFTALAVEAGVARLTTLDVAPSRPSTVWALGLRDGAPPVLLRSDGEAMPLRAVEGAVTDASSAWLSAVDPRDPETLWARVQRVDRTELRRTSDGGRSWRTVFEMPGAMTGFALSSDGGRVWAGGQAGLWRSDGAGFVRVETVAVTCLRHHGDALYVCTDASRDGVALARIADGSDELTPLLRYRDAEGAPDCPTRAPVFSACAPLWRAQRELVLRTQMDASVATPAPDAGGDSSDASSSRDVTALDATLRAAPGEACGCAVGERRGRIWGLWGVLLVVRAMRRRLAP